MEILINGVAETRVDQISVADLIVELELQPNQVAVEVNRELVPRQDHADCLLSSGDEVEIVTLVGGG